MQILVKETFDKFGYWPKDLSFGSPRKIVHSCPICGKPKETPYRCFLQNKYTSHPRCQIVRTRNTCRKKYGVDHPHKCKQIRERTIRTNLARYGVKYPWQTETMQQEKRENCLNKYGVESTNQLASVKAKKRQTFLKRYGVPHVPQSEEVQEKIRQIHLRTWLKNCGVADVDDVYQAAIHYIDTELKNENYKLLSKTYMNSTTKLHIQCPLEHQYWATWDCWRWRHTRCPICTQGRNERLLGEIIRNIYPGHKVKGQDNLGFLGRQKVDFSVRMQRIAFEYDGEQHFRPVSFNGENKKKAYATFLYTKKLDRRKNRLCKKSGYVLIRVKYSEALTIDNVKSKIDQGMKDANCIYS